LIRFALRSAMLAATVGLTTVCVGGLLLSSEPGAVLRWVDSAIGDVGDMFTAPNLFSAQEARSVIEGVGRVLDGETLMINGQRVRLAGIQVPEQLKQCGTEAPDCISESIRALQGLVSSAPVRCVIGAEGATCYSGTMDINRELVRGGHAKAYRGYSATYVDDEVVAEAAGRGLWRSADLSERGSR
jgi:endonuclease YncB( thermonuclease family)